jgi:hypothetical protein
LGIGFEETASSAVICKWKQTTFCRINFGLQEFYAASNSNLAFRLRMKKRSVVTACLLGSLVFTAAVLFLFHSKRPNPSISQIYADPASCAQCHATEAAGYASTGMAHAFYRPKASDSVESPASSRQFYHAASGTY